MRSQKSTDNRNKLSKNSTQNLLLDRSPQQYYYQEVRQGLERIEAFLCKLENDPDNQIYLRGINASAQAVSDLAMIHGYEGVENIANKIRSTSERILSKKDELENSFVPKVKLALEVIRQVMELEEEISSQREVNKFDKNIERKQKKVESCTQRISTYFNTSYKDQVGAPSERSHRPDNDLNKSENPGKSQNNNVLFDIREIDSVMTLAHNSPGIDSGNMSSNFGGTNSSLKIVDTTKKMPANFTRPSESGEMSLKELTMDAKEQLSGLKQAIYELQVIPYAGNAIQHIRKACDTLQETARKINDKNLTLILNPLQELIQKKLVKTEPVSGAILELLNQTTDVIYNHFDHNKDDEKEIRELGHKIQKILNVQAVELQDQEMESRRLESGIEDRCEKKRARKNRSRSSPKRRSKK